MADVPISLDEIDSGTLRREVVEKVERFLAGISGNSYPDGGERIEQNFRTVQRSIAGLSAQDNAIHAINGDGRFSVGEAAAVCFVGSQEVIVLQIHLRIAQEVWLKYEYAFCEQARGRVPWKWTEAKAFFRAYSRSQTASAPAEVRAQRMRASAEKLLVAIRAGGHKALYKGAQLTDQEATTQVDSLRDVVFTLGGTVAETPEGGLLAVCFKTGSITKLRVFRRNPDGWLYATFELQIRHERSGTKYTWR